MRSILTLWAVVIVGSCLEISASGQESIEGKYLANIRQVTSGMVKAGEESASLDFLLRKIADFYMHTVKTFVPGLIKIFFPLTLIMVAWAFFIVPGVMFPAVFVMAFLLFLTI